MPTPHESTTEENHSSNAANLDEETTRDDTNQSVAEAAIEPPLGKKEPEALDEEILSSEVKQANTVPSIPNRPIRRSTTTSTIENLISSYSNESTSDSEESGDALEESNKDSELVSRGETLINDNMSSQKGTSEKNDNGDNVKIPSVSVLNTSDKLLGGNFVTPSIPRRPEVGRRSTKTTVIEHAKQNTQESTIQNLQPLATKEGTMPVVEGSDKTWTLPELELGSLQSKFRDTSSEDDAKVGISGSSVHAIEENNINASGIKMDNEKLSEQVIIPSADDGCRVSVDSEQKFSTEKPDHSITVDSNRDFDLQASEKGSELPAKSTSTSTEGSTTEANSSSASDDTNAPDLVNTSNSSNSKSENFTNSETVDTECLLNPKIPNHRPVPKIPTRPKKVVSDISGPTVNETAILRSNPKAPPPKPKKLSSKIEAFQQMFNNSESASSVPEKRVAPLKQPSDFKKLSSEKVEFANNIRNVVGRGIALPGMAALNVNQSTEELEGNIKPETEEPKLTNNIRRARKPKGRLPRSLKELTIIEKSSRFEIVQGHLWEHHFSKEAENAPVEQESESKVDEISDGEDEPKQKYKKSEENLLKSQDSVTALVDSNCVPNEDANFKGTEITEGTTDLDHISEATDIEKKTSVLESGSHTVGNIGNISLSHMESKSTMGTFIDGIQHDLVESDGGNDENDNFKPSIETERIPKTESPNYQITDSIAAHPESIGIKGVEANELNLKNDNITSLNGIDIEDAVESIKASDGEDGEDGE